MLKIALPIVTLTVVLLFIAGRLNSTEQQKTDYPCFTKVDSLMKDATDKALIPGGVVCITTSEGIIYNKAFGYRQLTPDTLPMTTDTEFDIASLSKPVGTAMALMQLVQDGKIDLNYPVQEYLPAFKGDAHVIHLLTHTSGLPAYMNVAALEKRFGKGNSKALIDTIARCPRIAAAGEKETYSCLNYIALQHIIEAASGIPFDQYVETHIFQPLGMYSTHYGARSRNIAATEIPPGDTLPLVGIVHDPLAQKMNNGISGNAGLFSTASDLALLGQFLLRNKQEEVIRMMTSVPDSLQSVTRHCLGWGKQAADITYMGTEMSENAYAHTGYTGTLMAVDPDRDIAVILLTNRVHPQPKGNINPLRAAVCNAVIKQIKD